MLTPIDLFLLPYLNNKYIFNNLDTQLLLKGWDGTGVVSIPTKATSSFMISSLLDEAVTPGIQTGNYPISMA